MLPPEAPTPAEITGAARDIVHRHVEDFRERWNSGISSPIRALTRFVGQTREALDTSGFEEAARRIKNLTIGDVDGYLLEVDGGKRLPLDLGLNPFGDVHHKIVKFVDKERQNAWSRRDSSLTRYQADALGLPPLREQFDRFLASYGLSFDLSETIITAGSLPGINMAMEAIQSHARSKGRGSVFVAPTPGFSVYYAQAEHKGMQVVNVVTRPEHGYCTSGDELAVALGQQTDDLDILYLTPMNNPTSTIYEARAMEQTLSEYKRLRPNGIVIVDLAYVEMVPKDRAIELLAIFEESDTLDQAIFAVSMSKNFGYPRLRCASLMTKNSDLMRMLAASSQRIIASQSSAMELEALAMWEHVTPEARESMFELFRRRQTALRGKLEANIPLHEYHDDVPLYVFLDLPQRTDFLDLFEQTGMCGVPEQVFGGVGKNVRFSVGIEPLASSRLQ